MKKQPLDTWATGILYRVEDYELERVGPALNFIRCHELNYLRPHYTKELLERLAATLDGYFRDRPLLRILNDPPTEAEQLEISLALARGTNSEAAAVLKELADNADALAVLNHRPAKADGEFLGVNRAVHFHVLREKGNALVKQMQLGVAITWGVNSSQIKDDYTKHGTAAQRIVERILDEAMRHSAYAVREVALDALASDMTYRATKIAPKLRQIKKRKLSA